MTLDMAERVFSALKDEPMLDSIHLAGGEATLQFDLLVDTVRLAVDMGVPLSYVETNAIWCAEREETREKLAKLRKAGLPAILVSASMFHNEFVPFAYTRNCVEIGEEVLGRGGVIVWLPNMYRILFQMPGENETHSLREFCEFLGISQCDPNIPNLYGVIPGGRAPEGLRECYKLRPAEAFESERCDAEIFSTTHFHIDLYGNLFTGFCAGLAAGTVENLHPEIMEESFPILHTLVEMGPYGLMEMASKGYDFTPREDGYVSKCDLCYEVRKHLHMRGDLHELRPPDYYRC
jgi:MoaA/NifB/PqqE/SkfB family radical SAM enzyme